MKLYKYNKDQLVSAIKNSTSIRQVLIKLNVSPYGGNYNVFKRAIKYFDLDISHFICQAWNKGKTTTKKKLEDYLNNKYPITSHKLRIRLIKAEIFNHQCSSCLRKTWINRPIPLELDHINGDNKNNNLNNLRLLCPNCHALTPTYRGRNKIRRLP